MKVNLKVFFRTLVAVELVGMLIIYYMGGFGG